MGTAVITATSGGTAPTSRYNEYLLRKALQALDDASLTDAGEDQIEAAARLLWQNSGRQPEVAFCGRDVEDLPSTSKQDAISCVPFAVAWVSIYWRNNSLAD